MRLRILCAALLLLGNAAQAQEQLVYSADTPVDKTVADLQALPR